MPKRKPEIDKDAMFRKIMPIAPAFSSDGGEAAPSSHQDSRPAAEGALLQSGGVKLKSGGTHRLVNIMEYAVVERLDEAFTRFKCCKCDKCRKDVAALSLNKLSPKYVVADEDSIPMFCAMINSSEVTSAIVQAILKVRANPRH